MLGRLVDAAHGQGVSLLALLLGRDEEGHPHVLGGRVQARHCLVVRQGSLEMSRRTESLLAQFSFTLCSVRT